MIETITIITLCVLYLVFFRPGKTEPLKNPLVIERPGQYHMTLAPQLNLAQPFVEAVAQQLGQAGDAGQNTASVYFEVRDRQVTAHGDDCYLLAITRRNGMVYFQATAPQGKGHDGRVATLRAFADEALARFPAAQDAPLGDDAQFVAAVRQVAQSRGVVVQPLS